jgi:hypothetical protein
MKQRQLRLGDILDDYCPRERRVTNHAVVAMVEATVKQTRCTTCDAEHEYKHAKVPRQRRKADTPAALFAQVAAGGPKRIAHEPGRVNGAETPDEDSLDEQLDAAAGEVASATEQVASSNGDGGHDEHGVGSQLADAREDDPVVEEKEMEDRDEEEKEDGPVHRPLIRASLPRPEGQQPPARPIPEFTIRQPGGRPNRFRPRHQRGGQVFQGNRSNGNASGGSSRGMRPGGGRPPQGSMSRLARRQGPPGRKRSK